LHLSTCNVVVATSRLIRAELESLHGGRLEAALVKPNAIDTSAFKAADRHRTSGEPLRLLCVSRIDPKKGLEYLIDAVRLLKDQGVRVETRVFGAPDAHSPESLEYADALHQQVTRLGLQDVVHFAGRRDSREVQLALEQAHIFVAPSVELPNGDKDGIPTAVLEAMAAGCAIVTTNAGSVSEAIEHEREGLIVPQRDAAALAGAIERLAADEAFATALRAAASARARRDFDVARSEEIFHASVRGAIDARQMAPAAMGARH
jgi:glycosyltransferase involved in cell wall biosynthesis